MVEKTLSSYDDCFINEISDQVFIAEGVMSGFSDCC